MNSDSTASDGQPPNLLGFGAPRFGACDLPHYRKIVGTLPRPSGAQIDNFVEFVCGAHSWYKHLPLLPPGVPFRFFIDPYSGYDRLVVGPDRCIQLRERTENTLRFHYTWMTTSDYRARFGYLSYVAKAGTSILLVSAAELHEYTERPVFFTADQGYWIPGEVAEAGCVSLTAIVHEFTPRVWVWRRFLPPPEARSWPEETGGMNTLAQILEVCEGPKFVTERERRETRYREITDEKRARLSESEEKQLRQEADELARSLDLDEDLVRLLEPEKRRLQREMGNAIRRMVQLVYD